MIRYISLLLFIGMAWGQSQDLSVDELIKHLDLEPHPAGGFFLGRLINLMGSFQKVYYQKITMEIEVIIHSFIHYYLKG